MAHRLHDEHYANAGIHTVRILHLRGNIDALRDYADQLKHCPPRRRRNSASTAALESESLDARVRELVRSARRKVHDAAKLRVLKDFTALKARFRDMQEAGFMIREIALVDTPPEPWPQSGFQLAAIHFQKGWRGKSGFTYL